MNNKGFRNEGLDFKRLGLFFQKRIWVVLLVALIGGGLGALSYQVVKSLKMPVEYEATSKMYIKFNVDDNGEVYQYYNGYTWNELLDSDPIMTCIMGYLPGYTKEEVIEATSADILSDIRLLTVTVGGENEKSVREIQNAVQNGLAGYATLSNEIQSITTIRTLAPKRIYWVDKTTTSLIVGAVIFGIAAFLIFLYMFISDDAIYVQSDLEKRYTYRALGVMPRSQKGLLPYLKELKTNIIYLLEGGRKLILIDVDNHADLRAADMEKILNWNEAGVLDGLENVTGELVWHVREESDDLFEDEEEKEWNIAAVNEDSVSEADCEMMRELGGVMVMVPFGSSSAPRKLERILTFLENQDVNIYGIIITEADEAYLGGYYS